MAHGRAVHDMVRHGQTAKAGLLSGEEKGKWAAEPKWAGRLGRTEKNTKSWNLGR
jgi:hypothetical protein